VRKKKYKNDNIEKRSIFRKVKELYSDITLRQNILSFLEDRLSSDFPVVKDYILYIVKEMKDTFSKYYKIKIEK
jgi:hypothetical protein